MYYNKITTNDDKLFYDNNLLPSSLPINLYNKPYVKYVIFKYKKTVTKHNYEACDESLAHLLIVAVHIKTQCKLFDVVVVGFFFNSIHVNSLIIWTSKYHPFTCFRNKNIGIL